MSEQNPSPDPASPRRPPRLDPPRPSGPRKRRILTLGAVVAAFVVGAGASTLAQRNHPVTLVALTPAPVSAMRDWSPVAVKGQVAEIFGNKFVIEDESGRALVETGPAGEGGKLVAKSETVTVQGRFEHGFIHAAAISHADGRSELVGPPGPPRGPMSWRDGGIAHWFGRHFERDG